MSRDPGSRLHNVLTLVGVVAGICTITDGSLRAVLLVGTLAATLLFHVIRLKTSDRWRVATLAGLFVILGVRLGVAAGVVPSKVPSVVGLSCSRAVDELTDAGFVPVVDGGTGAYRHAGSVVECVEEGRWHWKGDRVRIKARSRVPRLNGLDWSSASGRLLEHGLSADTTCSVQSLRDDFDQVESCSPAPGTWVVPGSQVHLVLAWHLPQTPFSVSTRVDSTDHLVTLRIHSVEVTACVVDGQEELGPIPQLVLNGTLTSHRGYALVPALVWERLVAGDSYYLPYAEWDARYNGKGARRVPLKTWGDVWHGRLRDRVTADVPADFSITLAYPPPGTSTLACKLQLGEHLDFDAFTLEFAAP